MNKNHLDDYTISISKNGVSPLVQAIHGGLIESGTSELAREIIKNNKFNSYILDGHNAPDYFNKTLQSGYLHVTSHRFNDPKLIELANTSTFCLSLHGFPSDEVDICIAGGATQARKASLEKRLKRSNPSKRICIDCCPPYLGKHATNIVNLCQQKGIQLEMNPGIRKSILLDKEFKDKLASDLAGFLRLL